MTLTLPSPGPVALLRDEAERLVEEHPGVVGGLRGAVAALRAAGDALRDEALLEAVVVAAEVRAVALVLHGRDQFVIFAVAVQLRRYPLPDARRVLEVLWKYVIGHVREDKLMDAGVRLCTQRIGHFDLTDNDLCSHARDKMGRMQIKSITEQSNGIMTALFW